MQTSSIRLVHFEKYIFYALCGGLIVSFMLYGYFLNNAVRNVVERKNIESRIATLSTEVGEMEFAHISKQSGITLQYARSLGFEDTTDATFISRKSLGQGLSLNNEL